MDIFKFQKVEDALEKSTLASMLKVDLLTIAIGPEHHDIRLLDYKRSNIIIGRISFNVACLHIENISLDIKNIQCKVFHLVQNEVVVKLKFRDTQHSIETNYTDTILPKRLNKEEVTTYNWIEPEETEKSKLALQLQLSMTELRSSNSSINIYDIRMVDIDNTVNPITSNSNLHTLDTLTLYSKSNTENMKNTHGEVDEHIKLSQPNKNDFLLKPKYTLIGYANLNFYKILSENDNTITKQSSRFFQTFFSGNENYNGTNTGVKMSARSDGGFNLTNNDNTTRPQNIFETPEQNLLKFQIFDDISKPFVEELYFNGALIGKIEGTIVIKNIPLIRQIMCGVHTETGFDISSIHLNLENNLNSQLNSYSKDQETMPQELKILLNQTNNFLSNLLKATNLTQFTQSSRELNLQINQIMNDIKSTLQKSCKESALYYNYLNNKDLYKAQKIMLELGINILNMIESFNLEQRTAGFEILILINNRAEFDLGTLWRAWFQDSTQTSTIINTKFRENVLITDKIIENFITFNNICLDFVLERLSRGKAVDKESKTFVEFFLSVAYFRIPKFRNAFLDAISKNLIKDERIEVLDLDKGVSSVDDFLNIDPVNSLILWENLFYKRLATALTNTDIENEINDKLKETDKILNKETVQSEGSITNLTNITPTLQISQNKVDWKDRLMKRGLAFFSMINRLEKYIVNKVVKYIDIKWHNIPGFDIIIDTIIHELKLREVAKYPPQLLELLTIFINDSDIVNLFFRTIVTKTK